MKGLTSKLRVIYIYLYYAYLALLDLSLPVHAHQREKWKITDCERLSSFLGINIYYDRKSGKITFDVANKIDKIFEENIL